jgi:hypothetical protein
METAQAHAAPNGANSLFVIGTINMSVLWTLVSWLTPWAGEMKPLSRSVAKKWAIFFDSELVIG